MCHAIFLASIGFWRAWAPGQGFRFGIASPRGGKSFAREPMVPSLTLDEA